MFMNCNNFSCSMEYRVIIWFLLVMYFRQVETTVGLLAVQVYFPNLGQSI